MAQGVASQNIFNSQIVDPKTGMFTRDGLKAFQLWAQLLAGGFDPSGDLKSDILPTVRIVGRSGTIGTILQHLSATGLIDPPGLPSATATEQGAVVMPVGAPDNQLGTAAIASSTAFDPAGAAAAAQTGAQTFATAAANTAQSNAEAVAAANLAAAFAPGISVTITTAKLTLAGTTGDMTFVNGLLTAQTPAT